MEKAKEFLSRLKEVKLLPAICYVLAGSLLFGGFSSLELPYVSGDYFMLTLMTCYFLSKTFAIYVAHRASESYWMPVLAVVPVSDWYYLYTRKLRK